MKRVDEELVRKVQSQFHNQKLGEPLYQAVRLPCRHTVQLLGTHDQYIKCPGCGKQFMYVHSMLNKKLYEK